MSKGFDNNAVGLSQLYSQLRTKTVPNTTAANGVNIRAANDGADPPVLLAPIVADGALGFRVRIIVANRGALGGTMVRISYFTTTVTAQLANATINGGAAGGALYGIASQRITGAVALTGAGGYVDVLPNATTGAVDVTLTLAAASGVAGLNIAVSAGDDSIFAPTFVTT